MAFNEVRDQTVDGCRVGDIDDVELGRSGKRAPRARACHGDDVRALVGELVRGSRTDAAGRAGIDAGLIDGARYAVATERVRRELAAVEKRIEAGSVGGLRSVPASPNPGEQFKAEGIVVRQATFDAPQPSRCTDRHDTYTVSDQNRSR